MSFRDQLNAVATTPARGALTQGKDVYLAFLRLGKDGKKLLRVTKKHVAFLYHYGCDGMPFEKAAQEAGLTLEQANRFWRRPDVQEWLEDRAREAMAIREWSRPEKWYAEGEKILSGEKEPTRAQLIVWQEFGDRAIPKPTRETNKEAPKVVINIDPSAVQEAMRRQTAIEAQIVKDTHAA